MPIDRPGLDVTTEDGALPGLIEADVDLVALRAADRFRLTFATRALPPGAFADPELRLTLQDINAETALLVGRPDSVTIDRIAGTTTVEGRDLAALMIDQALTETFVNQTASDVAAGFASGHGLATAITSTTMPVGRLFQSERSVQALATEWDLLCALAYAESFDLLLAADTLTFGPATTPAPIVLRVQDCIAVQETTAPAIQRAVELTVRSWDPAAAQPVVSTARRGRGTARRQHLTRPNLTQDAAERLAEATLADLARFERTAAVTMPGEAAIDLRSIILLEDRSYQVASLYRSWGPGGFTETLFLTASPS